MTSPIRSSRPGSGGVRAGPRLDPRGVGEYSWGQHPDVDRRTAVVVPDVIHGAGRRFPGPALAAFGGRRDRGPRTGREADDPDPDAIAAAGQLSSLGCWAVAAVEPEWLVAWWGLEDPHRRRELESDDLGMDLGELGRPLAERWGCDPLVVDAAWLHADHDGALNSASADPDRLAIVQEAYRRAEQTPWSIGRTEPEPTPSEPRLRILMAEVQARCTGEFVDADSTPREERMTRQNARLRLQLTALRAARPVAIGSSSSWPNRPRRRPPRTGPTAPPGSGAPSPR